MKRLSLIRNHLKSEVEVCIVATGRSPIHRAGGALKDISAVDLAGQTIKGVLEKYSIDPSHLEELYMGGVFIANTGQSPSKQAAVIAGLPDNISCMSVNKLCASGMKAVTLACLSIISANADCVIAGGAESMSNYPYLLNLRNKTELAVKDSINLDVLPDAVTKALPITIADDLNKEMGFTRQDLDHYASISCDRLHQAQEGKKYDSEIVSIQVRKTKKIIKVDEWKKGTDLEKLRPLYKNGTTTVGNACGLNDGASFIVLASRAKAIKENWKVLGTIMSFADAEQSSKYFPVSPSLAIPKALKQANLSLGSINFMELNEPFSCAVLGNAKLLKYPVEKINIYGGALSIGHPVGSSGCRIIITLLSALHQENGSYGVAGICNGAGGASALVLKKET